MNINELLSLNFQSSVSVSEITLSLALSLAIGIVIAIVNERLNKGFSYEKSFSVTLVLITVISTCIMISIGSNIALSLGLIGSLSIIRFRAVLKNTLDMAYLFWAISVGIALGSKNYQLAVIVAVFISTILYLIEKFNILGRTNEDYILIISNEIKSTNSNDKISNIFNSYNIAAEIKSASINNEFQTNEATYSLVAQKKTNFEAMLNELRQLDGNKQVSLFSPNSNLNI